MDSERAVALLRAWAAWSRADDRLLGYRPRRNRKAASLLTDAEALRVDRAVSRVPEPYRSLLIAIYVRRVPLAVAAFDLPLLVNASTAHAFALRLLGELLRNASGGLRSGDQARGRVTYLDALPGALDRLQSRRMDYYTVGAVVIVVALVIALAAIRATAQRKRRLRERMTHRPSQTQISTQRRSARSDMRDGER